MNHFNNCPVCGGELAAKRVEKLLKGGGNTVAIQVAAQVCLRCGERLYHESVSRSFAEIRDKLRNGEHDQFKNLGVSFTVRDNWPNKSIKPVVYG